MLLSVITNYDVWKSQKIISPQNKYKIGKFVKSNYIRALEIDQR